MNVTRHAPDPTHRREFLCSPADRSENVRHELVTIGGAINCRHCKAVIDMAVKCIAPYGYRLARVP